MRMETLERSWFFIVRHVAVATTRVAVTSARIVETSNELVAVVFARKHFANRIAIEIELRGNASKRRLTDGEGKRPKLFASGGDR